MGNSKLALYIRFLIHKIRKHLSVLSEEFYVFKHYIDKGTFLFGGNHINNTEIGKYSYVSYNSIIKNCEIGRYCSIGPNVIIGFGDHKIDSLSTHPSIFLNEILGHNEVFERKQNTFKKVIIKNDVWVGANVYIKNGVTIGNGVIIGSGAVIIKDIEDYSIVGGVPAKIIRKRFDENTISKLLSSEWWLKDLKDLETEIKNF